MSSFLSSIEDTSVRYFCWVLDENSSYVMSLRSMVIDSERVPLGKIFLGLLAFASKNIIGSSILFEILFIMCIKVEYTQ